MTSCIENLLNYSSGRNQCNLFMHAGRSGVPQVPGPRPRALARGRSDILVSVPERAILELLSDVGRSQGIEEARHLLDGARCLRLDVLDTLLAHLKRI